MNQRPSPKIPANSMILGDQGGGVPVLTGKHIRISIRKLWIQIGHTLPLVKIGQSRSVYSAVNLAAS